MVDDSDTGEDLQQLILDAAGDGIYGIDQHGRTIFGNAAATAILGWRTADILGRSSHDVHHHSYADGSPYPHEDCPVYAAIRDGKVHTEQDEVFWHTDGRPVPVEYTSTPIIRDGVPQGAVVVFRDISKRKQQEREREQAFAEIAALKAQLEQERDYLRDELDVTINFGEIVGESAALKRTLAQIEAVAATPATVLVLGESGVGKEMVARAIHGNSPRAAHPLVKVNCASIPKDLFESEFFGHVRGAFTGAHADRVGRLQLADGGTLFLDEVGEIPLSLQSKLLRALQERQFERVGEDRTRSADVRIVAATNRDLEVDVKAGRFREDLYYRLSVFPLAVPALRERPEDIAPLAQHFVATIARELGRDRPRINRQDMRRLKSHRWPGNIRELRNVIERAMILTTGERLRIDLAMPGAGEQPGAATDAEAGEQHIYTAAELRELERRNLEAALAAAGGKISGADGAAELLGLKPSTLAYRLRVLGVARD